MMRRMQTPLRPLLLVAVLLSCAAPSCEPPLLKKPLADPATATREPRLVGDWVAHMDDATAWLHVSAKAKDGAWLDFVVVVTEPDKGVVALSYEGFPSTVGAQRFLNLRPRATGPFGEDAKPADRFFLARFHLADDGTLAVSLLDPDDVAAAVTSRALKGSVPKKGAVRVDADPAATAAWLAQAGDGVFDPFATFRRAPRVAVSSAP